MEHIIGVLVTGGLTLLGGIVAHLFAHDIHAAGPRISRKLIQLAVLRLPEADRDRFETEWLAHLWECEGFFSKLKHAVECFIFAPKVAKLCAAREDSEACGLLFGVGDRAPIHLDLPFAVGFLHMICEVKRLPSNVKASPNDAIAKRLAEAMITSAEMDGSPVRLRELVDELKKINEVEVKAESKPDGDGTVTFSFTLVDRFGRHV